jgi:hypothetical protein
MSNIKEAYWIIVDELINNSVIDYTVIEELQTTTEE